MSSWITEGEDVSSRSDVNRTTCGQKGKSKNKRLRKNKCRAVTQ